MRRQSGFSLVEIVVSLGISTVLSLGTGTLIYKQIAQEKHFRNRNEIRDFERVVKEAIFMNQDACGDYLAMPSYPISGAASDNGAEITIRGVRSLANIGNIQAGTTFSNNRFQVQSVVLRQGNYLGRDGQGQRLYQSELVMITTSNGGSSMFGPRNVAEHHLGSPVFALNDAGAVVRCSAATIQTAQGVCDPASMRNGVSCAQWYDASPLPAASGCNANNPFVTGVTRIPGASQNDPPVAILSCNENYNLTCRGTRFLRGVGQQWISPVCAEFTAAGTAPRVVVGPVTPALGKWTNPNCAELAQEVQACQAMVQWFGGYYDITNSYCDTTALAACRASGTPTPTVVPSPAQNPRPLVPNGECICGEQANGNPRYIVGGRICQRCHLDVERDRSIEFSVPVRTQYRCVGGNLQLVAGNGVVSPFQGACTARYETW
jgi:type II secretory pathway pseudopilin PulG